MQRAELIQRCRPSASKHERRGSGQALVEFALILPVFLVLMMGVIDFGAALYTDNAIQNGAREGARFGSVHPTWVWPGVAAPAPALTNPDPDSIAYRAKAESGTPSNPLTITVTCITAGGTSFNAATDAAGYTSCAVSGSRIDVLVQTQFVPLTPLVRILIPDGLTLSGHTVMTIE